MGRKWGEEAVDGVVTGLIGEGETVTFLGRHFGMRRQHTIRVATVRPYSYFRDVMVAGTFPRFEHDRHFAPMDDGTRIRDEIHFSTGWGPLKRILARRRLTDFLMERNSVIKRVAESEEWRKYLDGRMEGRMMTGGKVAAVTWTDRLRSTPVIAVPRPPNA